MTWPFSRNSRKLELVPDDEQRWAIAKGAFEGTPLIVRYNKTAAEWAGHPELPVKLGFAVPFRRPNAGGFPDAEENEHLGAIEDVLVREVLPATRGVYVLALTTGVMKEFIFYIPPGVDIAALHARIRDQVSGHEVQCMAVEEPEWSTYRTFAP